MAVIIISGISSFKRKATRQLAVRGIPVGGGAPVTVQSMTNTKTHDTEATLEQISRMERAGCDIVRMAVPDMAAAEAIAEIRRRTDMPLVADIHFDYKLALKAVENGIDKVRINPGNLGKQGTPELEDRVKAVVNACGERGIPIRVGVNSGSVPKDVLEKYGSATPEALVQSALIHIELLERYGFYDTAVSIKASNVPDMIESYRLFASLLSTKPDGFYIPAHDYPLHLGVTEAGTSYMGIIKSSVGIGTLLSEGIGDTIRVSLTADPVEEIPAGIAILKALGLRQSGAEVISCPTCGRCKIDLITLANEVTARAANIKTAVKIAVMGCVVNGPGEAKDADYCVTGGNDTPDGGGEGIIFKNGEIVGRAEYAGLADRLFELMAADGIR